MGIFFRKDRKIGYFGFMKKQRNIQYTFGQNWQYFIILSSRVCCSKMIEKGMLLLSKGQCFDGNSGKITKYPYDKEMSL